jgi:hypothetical protein
VDIPSLAADHAALYQSHFEIAVAIPGNQYYGRNILNHSWRKEIDPMAERYKVDCRKFPSDQGCTVTISGSIDEVIELGWLHAKTHHAHKDDEETGIKEWIRGNAEATND